ncbi:DUF4235 domain-containing protein [Actinocorallia longicatena]|uniref:DUF4235 domain-containing protein n=1 Tax=Actinocorallia longicatena TaxID=111803 RepID=UPI0031DD6D62
MTPTSPGEVLIAATVQGAIAGAVRAAVQRGGAQGVRKATGSWPSAWRARSG